MIVAPGNNQRLLKLASSKNLLQMPVVISEHTPPRPCLVIFKRSPTLMCRAPTGPGVSGLSVICSRG
jgi:hypothetical protein